MVDQASATKGLECPVCGGPLEIVEQGHANFRLSCMKNDFQEDDSLPMPCAFKDVYGDTPETALKNFKDSVKVADL